MFNNISLGQYIPAQSILHELDSRSKIIATFLLMLAVFMATFPVQLGILLLVTIILVRFSGINITNYVKAIRPFLFIIIVTLLLQIIFIRGRIFLDLYLFSISVEGLQAAAALTLRLIIIIFLVSLLTMTTTPMAITGGLEKIMGPFKKLGFPTHELIMIMTISLRFIPIFMEEASRIKRAQMCRGAVFRQGSLVRRTKSLISVLIPLFNNSFKRAHDLTQAMESRSYHGREGRSHMYDSKMKITDYLYMFLLSGTALIIIILN